MKPLFLLLVIITANPLLAQQAGRRVFAFNNNWQIFKIDSGQHTKMIQKIRTGASFTGQFNDEHISDKNVAADSVIAREISEATNGFKAEYPLIKNLKWTTVSLPSPVKYEQKLNPAANQFAGICYYRKYFLIPKGCENDNLYIQFEGAMQTASVWVNGNFITQHRGGYLPFTVYLNKNIIKKAENEIIIRLDNRDDKNTPPGKSLSSLGFLYWSGIYRTASLVATKKTFITNAVDANKIAGGGIFVQYENVSDSSADISIKTNIKNIDAAVQALYLKQVLTDKYGNKVKEITSEKFYVLPDKDTSISMKMIIKSPKLWSPDFPYLYNLNTQVLQHDKIIDAVNQRVGIRTLSFTRSGGFILNGKAIRIVGTNRHQDYPFVGNALSANMQYRDLKKIKDAGMNFIRLSHYPNDPCVYNICDSLGLMIDDEIPGWQFFNNNLLFKKRVFDDIREMIRRDRNHPSVIMWEASLNESYPPDSFRIQSAAVAHEEYPGDQMFTCGDTYAAKKTNWDVPFNGWVDPFGRPQIVQPDKPGFVREYGDYEFGGANSTTHATRKNGETALLHNAWNLQWEHNLLRDSAYYPWTIGDANWAYADGFEAFTNSTSDWGIVDVYRLPKFSYYFFKSQQNAISGKPFTYIANWWTPRDTLTKVIVYSNCDEVALYINNTLIKRQKPDNGANSEYGDWKNGGNTFDGGNCKNLLHPPFTFTEVAWKRGTLKAVGLIKGKPVCENSVSTPGTPVGIKLWADTENKPLVADNADAIFIHAAIIDKNNTVECLDNSTLIRFSVKGNGKIVSDAEVTVNGGIATILLKSTLQKGNISIYATADTLSPSVLHIKSIAP